MTAVISPHNSSLALSRALVNIADYLGLHNQARVSVFAPIREFLNKVPNQSECRKIMGHVCPASIQRNVKWRLYGVEGLIDIEELVNHLHPDLPKLYFVSMLSDKQTEIIQKANPTLDHESLLFAWEGEITKVIVMRITIGQPVSHQYIAVAIR